MVAPAQVQGAHLGVGPGGAKRPHRRGDEQGGDVPDDDPLRHGGGARGRGRRPGGAQHAQRLGEERLAGRGQRRAPGVALEEAGADLVLEAADLAAEGRLGEVERCRGPPEVEVLGHDGEAAHEPEVQVVRRGRMLVVHGERVVP